MHPFQDHKAWKVEHSRVGKMTKGYASGGAVRVPSNDRTHSDDDPGMFKTLAKENRAANARYPVAKSLMKGEHFASGGAVRGRADRVARARGGKVKHSGKTNVNVIVAPHHPMMAGGPMGAPAPAMAPPPAMAPRPPMAVPPQAGVGGPPPGVMPVAPGIRRAGGRAYAKGGAVTMGDTVKRMGTRSAASGKTDGDSAKHAGHAVSGRMGKTDNARSSGRAKMSAVSGKTDGDGIGAATYAGNSFTPAYKASLRAGTKVQHADGKMDGADIGRPKPITYAKGGAVVARKTGGPIEAPQAAKPLNAWEDGYGSGGGKGRLNKAHRAARQGHGGWA